MHVLTSLFLDKLLQLPKVWMVLEMSVSVRETSGSFKRENSDTLTHGKCRRRETRLDMQHKRSVRISVRINIVSLVILKYQSIVV